MRSVEFVPVWKAHARMAGGPEGAKENSPVLSEAMHRVRVKGDRTLKGGRSLRIPKLERTTKRQSPASFQDALHCTHLPRQRVARPWAVLLVPGGDAWAWLITCSRSPVRPHDCVRVPAIPVRGRFPRVDVGNARRADAPGRGTRSDGAGRCARPLGDGRCRAGAS